MLSVNSKDIIDHLPRYKNSVKKKLPLAILKQNKELDLFSHF